MRRHLQDWSKPRKKPSRLRARNQYVFNGGFTAAVVVCALGAAASRRHPIARNINPLAGRPRDTIHGAMKINEVTSSTNAHLKKIRSLQQRKEREKLGLFLIEGPKPVSEAMDKGVEVVDVVVSQTYLAEHPEVVGGHDISAVTLVDDKLFKELTTTTTPPGIIAVAKTPVHSFEDLFATGSAPLIVVAEAVQDPGNLGTMIRTSLAASASGMILTRGTVDVYSPKVVRAAMGALFALPIIYDMPYSEAVEKLRGRGVKVVACEPTASKYSFQADLTVPVALVFGNEGQGFAEDELAVADEVVSIPMNPKSESLNVAISAGIILFNAVEQRLKAELKQ